MSNMIYIDTAKNNFLTNKVKMNADGSGIIDLIKDVSNPIGLEIGSDVGDTICYLLDNNKELFMHSVDPYENYIDWNGNNLNERENVYRFFLDRVKKFENRCTQHRMRSDDAVSLFDNNFFDFIFIDGLHTYDQLTKDCFNYYPKLKLGGLFCGHDYTVISGVHKAANEFANKVNKKISTTINDVWYWYK